LIIKDLAGEEHNVLIRKGLYVPPIKGFSMPRSASLSSDKLGIYPLTNLAARINWT
jgi:hypothetical protein